MTQNYGLLFYYSTVLEKRTIFQAQNCISEILESIHSTTLELTIAKQRILTYAAKQIFKYKNRNQLCKIFASFSKANITAHIRGIFRKYF